MCFYGFVTELPRYNQCCPVNYFPKASGNSIRICTDRGKYCYQQYLPTKFELQTVVTTLLYAVNF